MSERFQRSRYPLSERLIQGAGSRLARSGGGGFSYDQLSETYPTLDVRRATAPRYVQEELDERDLILKEREAIVARRQADLQILDTQINQQRAMYEQIPMARQAISELDPMDDDFLTQFIAIQNENPLAFEDDAFYKNVASPLLRRHEMLQQNKMIIQRGQKPEQIQTVSPKDYEDMVVRRNALLGRKTLDELQSEDPDTAFAVEQLNRMISDYQQQNIPRGGFAPQPIGAPSIPSPTAAPTPQPQGGGLRALQSLIGE